jgi:hypothetical protein
VDLHAAHKPFNALKAPGIKFVQHQQTHTRLSCSPKCARSIDLIYIIVVYGRIERLAFIAFDCTEAKFAHCMIGTKHTACEVLIPHCRPDFREPKKEWKSQKGNNNF